MASREALTDPSGSTPVPDPTLLTTQQLLREMANLKEVVFTRLDGMDRAIILFNDNLTRVPTATDRATEQLKQYLLQVFATMDEKFEVVSERFNGIATQFRERDTRVDQTARASKEALDAALQAAKEAVATQQESNSVAIAKSETATGKTIDALGVLIQSTSKGTDDKITDIKDRLSRLESTSSGKALEVQERHASVFNAANIIGMIFGAIGMLVGLVGIVSFFMHTAKP